MNQPLVYGLYRQVHCPVAKLGRDKRWKHISVKPTPRWELIDSLKMTGLIGSRCKCRKALSRGVLIDHSFFSVRIDTDFRYLSSVYIFLLERFCCCAFGHGRTPRIEFCGGDYTGVVPPVPISNTEVKYSKADDSVMNAKVGSRHLRT